MLDLGRRLYSDCCALNDVKPNSDIINQVDCADLMHLRQIDASRTFLGCHGVHALLDFVQYHSCIESLLLPQNGVEAECVEHLCRVITDGHPRLAHVDLSGNPLSTPSVRLLWGAACARSTLTNVVVEGCGVAEDWMGRLRRALEANLEFKTKGFFSSGSPRPLASWHTAFVLVLGDEERVRHYCASSLLVLGSYMAPLRVRVAAMVVKADDTQERMRAKVRRCQDASNYNLTWCVVFLDPTMPLSSVQRMALESVLTEEVPAPPPLRSKLGVLRDPVYEAAKNLFLYAEVEPADRPKYNCDVLPSKSWLPMAGYTGAQLEKLCAAVPYDAKLVTRDSVTVKCQSDLITSLNTVFSETVTDDAGGEEEPNHEVTMVKVDAEGVSCSLDRDIDVGALHVKKSAVVLSYIDERGKDVSVPLLIYGAGDIGKSEMLLSVAHTLRGRGTAALLAEQDERSLTAGAKAVAATEPLHVVSYNVDANRNSVIVFLYHMLDIFMPPSAKAALGASGVASMEFCSINALTSAVSRTIKTYQGPPMAVLISCVDVLDTCGFPVGVAADWLPQSFPGHVRIVLSLNTESPVLPLLRKRAPQPYECLVPPIEETNRVLLFRRYLRERQIVLPGLERDVRTRDALKVPENTFLQREGASTVLYPLLAASYTEYLLDSKVTVSSEYDTVDFLTQRLPDTVEELVVLLCQAAEAFNDPVAVRYVLLCLAVAPLPVPEMLYICEELGPCARHSTLPTLLHLADSGLVAWYPDSTAHLPHRTVRNIVLRHYEQDLDRVSVLVENHLHRLVVTRSPEAASSFKHLMRVMVNNGSFVQSMQLLLNTVILDNVLGKGRGNVAYVIDGYFRLVAARELLSELEVTEGLESVGSSELDDVVLLSAMRDVQRCRGRLFQLALLQRSWSPLARDAVSRLSGGTCPYTVLQPLNTGSEDSSAATLVEGDSVCVHCHGRGDHFVATTSDTVIVYDTRTCTDIARLTMPFENNQRIRGSLMASGTRVMVIGDEQLLIWDFECDSFFLFGETTTSTRGCTLNSFGTTAIATRTLSKTLCVIDVTRKIVLQDLPFSDSASLSSSSTTRDAIFCGNHVLLKTVYDLFLFNEELKESVRLPHDGPIRAIGSNADGRLLASSVGCTLWVWTSHGELLHRLQAGLTPITHLAFDPTGTFLLTAQAEGVKQWKTVTGTHTTTLSTPFGQDIEQFCFSEDSTRMIASAGDRVMVWDAQTTRPIGAFTARDGVFVCLHEQDNTLFAASSSGDIKAFNLVQTIPSLHQAHVGVLSTDWLRNAKVSEYALDSVSTNASSTFLVTLDARQQVQTYSLTTGHKLSHGIDCPVRAALALGPDTVAYVPAKETAIHFERLSTLTESVVRFPKETVEDAEVRLFKSDDERFLGVTYFYLGRSRMFAYDVEKASLICQFNGHSGRICHACFSGGSFVYTVGEEGCIRLWTLSKVAERTSYVHPERIVAAACDSTGMLVCLDICGNVYRVHVDHITSASRATFVLTRIDMHGVSVAVQTYGVNSIVIAASTLFLAMKDGSIFLVNMEREEPINHVTLSDRCTCLCVCTVNGSPALITCVRSGRAFASKIYGLHAK